MEGEKNRVRKEGGKKWGKEGDEDDMAVQDISE